MRTFLAIVCVAVLVAAGSCAFPGGAPEAACQDMTPMHGFDPLPGPSPYTFRVTNPSANKYQLDVIGDPVVEVVEGFMIQARDRTTNTALGTFDAVPGKVQVIDCFGENTQNCATHAVYEAVESISVTWNAPDGAALDNVDFVCTVLRELDQYWVNETVSVVARRF